MKTVIEPIRDHAAYERALKEVEELWDAPEGTSDGDRLEVLTILVRDYEERRYWSEIPENPVAAILHAMDRLELSRKDLEPMLGSRGRVSEVLNGTRGLSLEMIRRLHRELRIPLESLIADDSQSAA